VIIEPPGTSPGSQQLDSIVEREPALAHQLEHDRGDERFRRATDAEAVGHAQRRLRLQVAVSARTSYRPAAYADERDRAGAPAATTASSAP
jgi:hypothetical protein